jgi:hypothetical protein
MRTLPQELHADLGIVDDDHTEALTKRKPPAGTEGFQKIDHPTNPQKLQGDLT